MNSNKLISKAQFNEHFVSDQKSKVTPEFDESLTQENSNDVETVKGPETFYGVVIEIKIIGKLQSHYPRILPGYTIA